MKTHAASTKSVYGLRNSTSFSSLIISLIAIMVLSCFVTASYGSLNTTLSSQYLIIGRNRVGGNTDVATNNFEIGANKAPVPCTDKFLDGGSSGGPTLDGAVPNFPANAAPVYEGICGNGNIAVTDSAGEIELQNVGVYANPAIGIRLAGSSESLNKCSNSFFNDPCHFPNTYDPITKTGNTVNPNQADQLTRIDPTTNGGYNAGITFGYDHSGLLTELAVARTTINGMASTGTLNTNSGKISSDTTFTASSGLNVIDIDTDNNDFLIENCNFMIDGPSDATVIFRLPDSDNMLISNSNVIVGNGGIGMSNVMFYTDQDQSDTHFSFSNTILNGVAFWSLGPNGGSINISNAQGCTQLVADIVDLDNVRFTYCGVPEPATIALLTLGAIAFTRRRKA